jgi:hypothetical protein
MIEGSAVGAVDFIWESCERPTAGSPMKTG